MLLYEQFFRKYGVRNPQLLLMPLITPIEKFEFPKNSVYHYVNYDTVTNGPSGEDVLIKNIERKIFCEHILDIADNKGAPKKVSLPLLPYVREFHAKNKKFRLADDISVVGDENTLCIVNYSLVSRAYRYIRSFYTEYYKWWNIQKTLWKRVGELTTSGRNQFIFVNVPVTLPSVARLEAGSKLFNQNVVKFFPTEESLFLLEVWKWLGIDSRAESVIPTLPTEQLNKVNIVFMESGKWFMVNLGAMDSWRYINDVTPVDQKIKIAPAQLQKRLLRGLMGIMEFRVDPNLVETVAITDTDGNTTKVTSSDDNQDLPVVHVHDKLQSNTEVDLSGADEVTTDSKVSRSDEILENLEADLKQLEIIEHRNETEKARIVATQPVENTKSTGDVVVDINGFGEVTTLETAIKQKCDALAEDGILTALQYKKLTKMAEDSGNLKAPYGEQAIKDFIVIKPEDVKIVSSTNLPDIKTVPDKTMLKSSLLDFDEKYIEKVLPKDVVGMVTNVQRSGLIISKYDVEVIEDYLGKYEMHSVRINPIEGMPSTIRFKIPTLEKDGTYLSNSVKYRMRKQRGSLPIVKIDIDRVGLTSYYGKSFVTRSTRKINNYSAWLTAQVMLKGLDELDLDITNLAPADVFDNTFESPRAYSTLAMSFKSFTSHGFDFIFDHKERLKVFTPEQLKEHETNGRILIASNAVGDVLTIDSNNTIYNISKGEESIRGTIESVLNISTTNAPVEYTEVKIFGKDIPVGIVLAYLIGFDNLITLLKATYRTVPAGQRVNLQDHEYALVFSDETLIFDRDNRVATFILNGFKATEKTTRIYTRDIFNQRGVYLNLLEALGLSVRYLREIDLIDSLFIDPITLGLLQEMKEPTTFRGLLVRASEMLIKDTHPDSLDMAYMRIKGYERISGAVYAELVQAIREHKAKSGKANQPIDLHPYAVWKRITQDPAIGLVSDINPIENLKQQEAVTFSGVGGRNSRSMVKRTRIYHPNDMGVISESTVDSSDVAINTFLSADPQFDSLRGTSKRYVVDKSGATALLSTSALLSVGSDRDD